MLSSVYPEVTAIKDVFSIKWNKVEMRETDITWNQLLAFYFFKNSKTGLEYGSRDSWSRITLFYIQKEFPSSSTPPNYSSLEYALPTQKFALKMRFHIDLLFLPIYSIFNLNIPGFTWLLWIIYSNCPNLMHQTHTFWSTGSCAFFIGFFNYFWDSQTQKNLYISNVP